MLSQLFRTNRIFNQVSSVFQANVTGSVFRNICTTVTILMVSGCAWFSWIPGIEAPPSKEDEPRPLVAFNAEAKVNRLWKVGIGSGLGSKYVRTTPAIIADRIFAADAYGQVEARNRFDGKTIWQARIGEHEGPAFWEFWDLQDPAFLTGGVGKSNGIVLVGTTLGVVIALDASNGSELWRSQVSSEILAPPTGNGDIVAVQTGDGKLFALEHDSGEVRWIYDTQMPVLTLRGTATPTILDDIVYAGFATGMVVAVDISSGAPLWEQRIMLPEGRSELQRMVDVDGTPLVDRNFVYAVAYQGKLKAMRRRDGAILWETDMSSYLDLAEGYGQIYVINEDDEIFALGQGDATVAWERSDLKHRRLTSPSAFGNYLVVGDDAGYMHVFAQSDGRMIARTKVGRTNMLGRILYQDGIMYVLSNNGVLSAFEIRRNE